VQPPASQVSGQELRPVHLDLLEDPQAGGRRTDERRAAFSGRTGPLSPTPFPVPSFPATNCLSSSAFICSLTTWIWSLISASLGAYFKVRASRPPLTQSAYP